MTRELVGGNGMAALKQLSTHGNSGADARPVGPAAAHRDEPVTTRKASPGISGEQQRAVEEECLARAGKTLKDAELLGTPTILGTGLYVALAVGKRPRPFWPDADAYLFDTCIPRVDDDDLDIQRMLDACERLSDKANAYTSGLDLRIIHQQLFTQASDAVSLLAGRMDCRGRSSPGSPKDGKTVKYIRASLAGIEREIDESAQRDAQLRYFAGMVAGVAAIVLANYQLGGLNIPGSHRLANASFVAGAVGAVMSVLMRMTSGELVLRYRVGAWYTRFLGFFRPVIGSVFGILMYFLISSGGALALQSPAGFDKRFFFFAVVAFLAGFSERFAPDMLSITEDSLVTRARRRDGGRARRRRPTTRSAG